MDTRHFNSIFPKYNLMPKIKKTIDINGEKIHFTEGVDLKYFKNVFENSQPSLSKKTEDVVPF